MADIISSFGWKYISTVGDEGNYGEKGIAAFENLITKTGLFVCTAYTVRCTLYGIHCTVYTVRSTMHVRLCAYVIMRVNAFVCDCKFVRMRIYVRIWMCVCVYLCICVVHKYIHVSLVK